MLCPAIAPLQLEVSGRCVSGPSLASFTSLRSLFAAECDVDGLQLDAIVWSALTGLTSLRLSARHDNRSRIPVNNLPASLLLQLSQYTSLVSLSVISARIPCVVLLGLPALVSLVCGVLQLPMAHTNVRIPSITSIGYQEFDSPVTQAGTWPVTPQPLAQTFPQLAALHGSNFCRRAAAWPPSPSLLFCGPDAQLRHLRSLCYCYNDLPLELARAAVAVSSLAFRELLTEDLPAMLPASGLLGSHFHKACIRGNQADPLDDVCVSSLLGLWPHLRPLQLTIVDITDVGLMIAISNSRSLRSVMVLQEYHRLWCRRPRAPLVDGVCGGVQLR